MAPTGKKKKDAADGTSKQGRSGRDSASRGEKRERGERRADPRSPVAEPEDEGSSALPGGLTLPGANLIGPGAELAIPPDAALAAAAEATPAELGATKYVHAAFFIAGILLAFLSGKVLGLFWNLLADWHLAVQAMPFLLRFGEGERATITSLIGVVIGVLTVVQTYRREAIRKWADDVALELARVTWPTKDTVTNGTIVVIVASVVATVYVALLDQFWGFVTRLIYEA